MFEDDGLFTPCHCNMQGTEGVNQLALLGICVVHCTSDIRSP